MSYKFKYNERVADPSPSLFQQIVRSLIVFLSKFAATLYRRPNPEVLATSTIGASDTSDTKMQIDAILGGEREVIPATIEGDVSLSPVGSPVKVVVKSSALQLALKLHWRSMLNPENPNEAWLREGGNLVVRIEKALREVIEIENYKFHFTDHFLYRFGQRKRIGLKCLTVNEMESFTSEQMKGWVVDSTTARSQSRVISEDEASFYLVKQSDIVVFKIADGVVCFVTIYGTEESGWYQSWSKLVRPGNRPRWGNHPGLKFQLSQRPKKPKRSKLSKLSLKNAS